MMETNKHMHFGRLKRVLLAAAMACTLSSAPGWAQWATEMDWYVGAGAGMRFNGTNFSQIKKGFQAGDKYVANGLFSLFVQGEFGANRNYAFRPQLSILSRGGKMTDIQFDYPAGQTNPYHDVYYRIKGHYFDFRVPLIVNVGAAYWQVRPYAFVAPVLGIATGGHIQLHYADADNVNKMEEVKVTNANLSSTNFAAQFGIGAKLGLPLFHDICYLGLELAYEHGISDTYSKKEKNHQAENTVPIFDKNYKITGSRHFKGFELQVNFSVPFSAFSKAAKRKRAAQTATTTTTYIVPVAAQTADEEPVAAQPVADEGKRIYTLDEIEAMIADGQSVVGKTIYAIDDITFNFAQSTIRPESFGYLNRLARTIVKTNSRVLVSGHTDSAGSDEVNMKLSKERAEAVLEYLVKQGVSRRKLSYDFYGKSRPISDNSTSGGRALNRRVEFTILED